MMKSAKPIQPDSLPLRERVVSRALQRYWRVSRGLTMGAQGIVLDEQDRVLLVRHGYRKGWFFPGGGVEKNETIHTTLLRELEEEVGVLVDGPTEFVGLFAHFASFPSDHIALFVVRNWTRPHIPEPNMEIAEQAFFDIDALPQGTSRGTRARLDELVSGTPPASHW